MKGVDYSYHAWLISTGRQILRYDMAHDWIGLHCHVFDLDTGDEQQMEVGLDDLPTLDAFIRMVIHRVQNR